MESMSLDGNLERKIVLDKICQQSKKDETGRRHSFRISQVEIQRDLQKKIQEELDNLLGENKKQQKEKVQKIIIKKHRGMRKSKKY